MLTAVGLLTFTAAACHRKQQPPPPPRRVIENRPPGEFLKYRQTVIETVRKHYQPGSFRGSHLVTTVFFEIQPDGALRGAETAISSGNIDFDIIGLRAIADTGYVPPPPPNLMNEFRRFLVQFRADG